MGIRLILAHRAAVLEVMDGQRLLDGIEVIVFGAGGVGGGDEVHHEIVVPDLVGCAFQPVEVAFDGGVCLAL